MRSGTELNQFMRIFLPTLSSSMSVQVSKTVTVNNMFFN